MVWMWVTDFVNRNTQPKHTLSKVSHPCVHPWQVSTKCGTQSTQPAAIDAKITNDQGYVSWSYWKMGERHFKMCIGSSYSIFCVFNTRFKFGKIDRADLEKAQTRYLPVLVYGWGFTLCNNRLSAVQKQSAWLVASAEFESTQHIEVLKADIESMCKQKVCNIKLYKITIAQTKWMRYFAKNTHDTLRFS